MIFINFYYVKIIAISQDEPFYLDIVLFFLLCEVDIFGNVFKKHQ